MTKRTVQRVCETAREKQELKKSDSTYLKAFISDTPIRGRGRFVVHTRVTWALKFKDYGNL